MGNTIQQLLIYKVVVHPRYIEFKAYFNHKLNAATYYQYNTLIIVVNRTGQKISLFDI